MSKSNSGLAKPRATDSSVPFDKKSMALWKFDKFSSRFVSSIDANIQEGGESLYKFKLSYFKTSSNALIVVQFASIEKYALVHYRVSLIDAADNQHFIQEGGATHQSPIGAFLFSLDSITAPDSGLLIDDTLKICCYTVKVFDDATDLKVRKGLPYNNRPQQLAATSKALQDYDSLLESAKFADTVLVVGNGGAKREFHAHKAILGARSAVFGAMFEHKNTKEAQESRVAITDAPVDAFEQFLRFVYTGKVAEMDKYAQDLLTIADKYQMDCLKSLCSHYLSSHLTTELVSSILVLADLHNAAELKSNCVDYFAEHADQVMATEDFKQIKNKPDLLIDLLQNHVKKHKK